MSNSQRVGDFFNKLANLYKEKRARDVCQLLQSIFENKRLDYRELFLQSSPDQAQKLSKLLTNDSMYYNTISEDLKSQYSLYVDFLLNFLTYYIERERGIQNIVGEYKKLFVSAGCLLADDNCKAIFRFTTKLILKEYQRIIKLLRDKVKDEHSNVQQQSHPKQQGRFLSMKQSTQLQKQLATESIAIMSELLRCVNQRHATELKLLVSNQQMKVHFMLYQFDRAAACDKPQQEPRLLEISDQSDIITYHYYKGRINIFSSRFAEASECLQRVLESCPNNEKGRKVSKQVLKYLIPVNMFLGRYPSPAMLKHFKLQEYDQLCSAVKTGNIKLLQHNIDQYRGLWIRRSLLILLDQLKVLAYRNLCKKVWLIKEKNKKINLDSFLTAFKFSHPASQPPSIQEVCCIIANLIYLRLITGKIYQNNAKNIRALTLSDEPFKGVNACDIQWSS